MENSTSALAVKNMVRTFQELGMKVVAEGVETEEQKQLVIDFGIDQIQGFYYSKPLAEEDFCGFDVIDWGAPVSVGCTSGLCR